VQFREITLGDGVTSSLDSYSLTINGPLGKATKDFSSVRARVSDGGKGVIRIESLGPRKKDLATFGTASSIVTNLVQGVTFGYEYKLKVAFAHFPVTVSVKEGSVRIENFYGERVTRTGKIVGDSKVSVKGDDVIVNGINKEHVGQTAANIEQATRVKRKDQRVFLDGIYLYEKGRAPNVEAK
jgi:large subunit ribosomal protein L6